MRLKERRRFPKRKKIFLFSPKNGYCIVKYDGHIPSWLKHSECFFVAVFFTLVTISGSAFRRNLHSPTKLFGGWVFCQMLQSSDCLLQVREKKYDWQLYLSCERALHDYNAWDFEKLKIAAKFTQVSRTGRPSGTFSLKIRDYWKKSFGRHELLFSTSLQGLSKGVQFEEFLIKCFLIWTNICPSLSTRVNQQRACRLLKTVAVYCLCHGKGHR